MKILNERGDDFSMEIILQLAICLHVVYAAEIICYKIARTLDLSGYVESLFQRRKQSFNKARLGLQDVIKNLEVAFDDTFDKIMFKEAGEENMRQNHLLGAANDLVEFLLIYYSRGDGSQEKKDRMKKALMNFKQTQDFDLEAIRKYYDFKW